MTRPRTILWQPDLDPRSRTIYQAIVDRLAADVAAGRLQPGDRIPTHRQLAKALGVGIGTVTRAYKEAEQRGILSSRVGRGSFIASPTPGNPLGLPSSRLIEMSVDLPVHACDPDLNTTLRRIARREDAQLLLRYQNQAGRARHRRAGAAWVERFDMAAGADEVVVCAGTHHALCVALMVVGKPGDVVLCDELCYPGLRAITGQLHMRLHGIPADARGEGIDLAAVETACKRQRVCALYSTPSLHNPTTRQLGAAKRRGLARLAQKYGFVVVEDDVHRLLSTKPPPPIATIARDRVFYVAGFSKAVAPGLRVAFLVPPPQLVQRVEEALWASVWTVSPLPVEVAATWIEDGTADATVRCKRDEAGARQELCKRALPEARVDAQANGCFAWLHLPPAWTSVEFALESRQRGVAVTPSTPFVVGQVAAPPAVRVCVGAPDTRDEVERGLSILGGMLRAGPSRRGLLVDGASTSPDASVRFR